MSVLIKSVLRHSYADRAGIKDGETLIAINGNDIVDVLDYRFYQLNSSLELKLRDQKGEVRTVHLRKPEYEELGLDFDTYLMDKEKSCRNKCVFCFIDQLPKGLRETLYFKDDDSRLSFLFGNYVTLTNLSEHEISRIIKMHISPINVSVHTTNPELRVKMMGNRFAGDSLKILKRFADSSIVINTQIVCCPGLNDGEELKRTLRDLYDYNVNLIAVVPVGLTKFREGLYPLTPFTKEKAAETVDILEEFGEMCLKTRGKRIAYAADELYMLGPEGVPSLVKLTQCGNPEVAEYADKTLRDLRYDYYDYDYPGEDYAGDPVFAYDRRTKDGFCWYSVPMAKAYDALDAYFAAHPDEVKKKVPTTMGETESAREEDVTR